MADPEQIYEEVRQEEQQKGSSAAVIEGRAKAARQRATEGSPHPKEPKWWPGAQPHFEGDGAGPADTDEAEDAAAPEPAAPEPAEEPAAEQPAAEAPAEQPAAQAPAEQPAAEAPAAQPAVQAPAAQPAVQAPAAQPAAQATAPAAQPAAQATAPAPEGGGVAVAEAPPRQETLGVSHGTPSGNRLRPEDSVSTEAQFAGQQAVYQRRKLIDDLVATGVPAVSATDSERRGSGFLVLLYLAIPLIAVALLASSGGTEPAPAEEGGGAAAPATSGDFAISADGLAFDADTIELAAGEEQTIAFDNQDSVEHNVAIYANEDDGGAQQNPLFAGDLIPGGDSIEYMVDPLKKGKYYFQCDVHPTMNGAAQVG